jgi:hypothetical protein
VAVEAGESRGDGRVSRTWGPGLLLVVGIAVGLVVGLAIGPFGAALLGFQLPYVRLTAPPATVTGSAPVQPKAMIVVAPAAATPHSQGPQTAASAPSTAGAPQTIPTPQGRAMTIGVFGDSLADGLWQGLYRHLRKADAMEVVRFSKPSTGLTRYDYIDVQAQTESQLAERHVDIAVVLFGTNDEQGILEDGKVYGFGTPAWRAAYGARIDALVALFRGQGAAVYWVGLPKMEGAVFDTKAGVLNDLLRERSVALGVPFIATVPATVDEHGGYDAYLATPGQAHRQLMRARDGIHMTPAGYFRMAAPVAERIRADLAAAPAAVLTSASAPAQSAPAAAAQ